MLTVGARECGQSGSGTAVIDSGSAPVVTPQEVLVCILALLLQHSRVWFPVYCLEKCSLCRLWCFLGARDYHGVQRCKQELSNIKFDCSVGFETRTGEAQGILITKVYYCKAVLLLNGNAKTLRTLWPALHILFTDIISGAPLYFAVNASPHT